MSERVGLGRMEVERRIDDYLKKLSNRPIRGRDAILGKLESVPVSCRRAYLLAVTGRSRSKATRIHCLECAGWNRGEVARCESVSCALWAYRPFKKARHRAVGMMVGNAQPT